MTYDEAKDVCNANQGHLVSINNEDEQIYVQRIALEKAKGLKVLFSFYLFLLLFF